MKGKVSVIMPLYNGMPYVQEAVESVRNQSFDNWELWVLDDASIDESVAYIRKVMKEDKRIHLLCNEKNLGAAQTRNRGIAAATGEYLAFLDSDDVWHRDKLQKQIDLLQKSGADIVCSSYSMIDERGKFCRADCLVPQSIDFSQMKRRNLMGCSTVLIRRNSLGDCRFRKEHYHEDYALWLELMKKGCRAAGVQESLVDYRIRRGSRSWSKYNAVREHWRILKELLGLSCLEQAYCMSCYAWHGLRKYGSGRRNSDEST